MIYRVAALLAVLLPTISLFAAQDQTFIDQIITQNGSLTSKALQMFLLITVLGLAPSILIVGTSFVRMIVVLSIVRSGIGLQQSPPNQVLAGLALFMTFFVMSPVMNQAYENGLKPMINEEITEDQAIPLMVSPFKKFMSHNTRQQDLELFANIAKVDITKNDSDLIPIQVIVPAFMISELRRAFEIGFLLLLPFLIIDIVVSSILMAMGMMMMPPVTISLPFKIIFFVVVDGWSLVTGSLIKSFVI